MKDDLKKYVDKHRDEFEAYQNDFETIWRNIDKDLSEKGAFHQVFMRPAFKVAASVVIVITLGIGFIIGKRSAEIEKNGIALHNISPELAETEAYYSSLIEDQLTYIHQSETEVSKDVWTSLDQLDKDYEELKKDLKDRADSEEVINAMIGYYRLKLEMLKQISKEIKENQKEDEEQSI